MHPSSPLRPLRRLAASSFALSVGLVTTPLLAADTPSGTLEEITVTAQKRESNLQDTPIAVTAFTGEMLEQSGIKQVQDIAQIAPSVNMSKNYTTTIITIRGVSSRDTGTASDPAIAVSQDDFPIQRPFGLGDTIYDLERVEVLRGPQGTLYGRSATGGAINFVANKPKDDFAARAVIGIGNYDALSTEGMLNVPLSETLAIRGSFSTERREGFRKNEARGGATPGDDANGQSGRLQLLWQPSDSFSVLLRGDLTHQGGIGPTTSGFAPVRQAPTGGIDFTYQPPLDRDGVPHGFPNQQLDMTIRSVQTTVNYDLPFVSLTYIGGYRDTEFKNLRDLNGIAGAADYFTFQENPLDQSHELRVSSNGEGRFTWQTGLFYFGEENSQRNTWQNYEVVPIRYNQIGTTKQSLVSKAVYGQAGFEIFDGLKLTAGMRYSKDDKEQTGSTVTPTAVNSAYGKVSSSVDTYHAGLNWQLTEENLLYAKYDTGFKPGGFGNIPGEFFTFGPEEVKSIEVGSKNRFLDNRLQVNLSAYHYDYTDQQVNTLITAAGASSGFTKTINAGESEFWGVELEPVFQITPADRVNATIAWLDAEFTKFCTATVGDVCTVSFAGRHPVQAPTWQVSLGYEHEFLVGEGTLTARLQSAYQSESFLVVQNYPNSRIDSYTRSDAFLTYKPAASQWSLQGYVRNIENSTVITAANTNFGYYSFGLAPPRTFGARLTFDFE
jgi:iron complex outermembrane receptor protein